MLQCSQFYPIFCWRANEVAPHRKNKPLPPITMPCRRVLGLDLPAVITVVTCLLVPAASSFAVFDHQRAQTTGRYKLSSHSLDMAASSDAVSDSKSEQKRDNGPAATKARKLYTFAEARKKARSYGFISQEEFIDYECAGTYQLPKNCHEVWSGEFISWEDFLGVPLKFNEAKHLVQQTLVKEKGVESEASYVELIKSGKIGDDELASRLPLRPDLYYKADWISWDNFLFA